MAPHHIHLDLQRDTPVRSDNSSERDVQAFKDEDEWLKRSAERNRFKVALPDHRGNVTRVHQSRQCLACVCCGNLIAPVKPLACGTEDDLITSSGADAGVPRPLPSVFSGWAIPARWLGMSLLTQCAAKSGAGISGTH